MKKAYVVRKQQLNGKDDSKEAEKESVKSIFQQWCQITTCAGVVDLSLARSKSGTAFWLTVIVVCLALTCWQTGKLFEDFIYGKPYATSITAVSDSPIYFPNVTVCNQNRINYIRGSNLSKNGLIYAFFSAPQDYYSSYKVITWYPQLKQYEEDYNDMMRSNNLSSVKEMFHKFGYSCEETFMACLWGAEEFDCCKYVTETISTNGRCWNMLYSTSNGTERLQQDFPGGFYGLKLLINPNVETYRDDVVLNSVLSKGVMIRTDYEQSLGFIDLLPIAAGSQAHIELTATVNKFEFTDITLRESPCAKNPTITFSEVEYSLANCISECWCREVYKGYGCVHLGPVHQQYQICTPQQTIKQGEARNLTLSSKEVVTCRKNCLPSCKETWFSKTSMTTSRFLQDPISLELMNLSSTMFPNVNITKQMLENLIHVNIFFSKLEYTLTVTSERNSLFTYISNVGGQLSLFLGISVVTIIQTCYFICLCIFSKK